MPFFGPEYSTPAFALPAGTFFGPGPMNPTGQSPQPGDFVPPELRHLLKPSATGALSFEFGSAMMQPAGGMPDPGLDPGFDHGLDPNQPPQRKRINAKATPAMPRGNGPLSTRTGPLGGGFGGAFANGGIAPAGKTSLVGERGPELIQPTGPTKVIPLQNASSPATGMLVPSSRGGVKWQPGTGAGTTLPPQSQAAMPFGQRPSAPPEMPFGMGAPGPVLVRSGAKTMNAVQTGPLSARGTAGAQSGPLSLRGPVPVGRSANDPMRIAEQMRRGGDPSAILRFGMQQMRQDFARARHAVNFAQNQMMFGQRQQAMDARDARNFEQGKMMFGMQQGAMDARDERNFTQQQQLEAERRAADQAALEQARQYGLKPVPVTGTQTPYFQDAQGRIYAGSQPEKAPDPMPQGLVPVGYQNGKAIYGQPDKAAEPKFMLRELPGEQVQDPVTNAWTTKPGQMVRVFEDGTYEPIQPRGQPKAAAPAPLDPAARLAALRAKAGLK